MILFINSIKFIATRKNVLVGLFLLLLLMAEKVSGAFQTGEFSPSSSLEKLVSHPFLRHALVGVLMIDAGSSDTLIEFQSDKAMIPASLQKILVSWAALETLGPDFTFTTNLEYSGTIDDSGILHGDLYITGGGDPALGSPQYTSHYGNVIERFQQSVSEKGIRMVTGRVIADASLYGEMEIPATWVWEDISNYYGATVCGLNYHENYYELTFSTPKKPGLPARLIRTSPFIPGLEFINEVISSEDSRDNTVITGICYPGTRRIRGTLPAGKKSFTIRGAIPDPAYLMAFQLNEALLAAGVMVKQSPAALYYLKDYQPRQHLLTILSPPLKEILTDLNTRSNNLYTEALLRFMARKDGYASHKEACRWLEAFLKNRQLPSEGLYIADASGLSRYNNCTAGHVVLTLKSIRNNTVLYPVFQNSLAVAGVSGTLSVLGKGTILEGNFRGKSGSMTRVFNYAGYARTRSGREVIVAILINHFDVPGREIRQITEKFLIEALGNL